MKALKFAVLGILVTSCFVNVSISQMQQFECIPDDSDNTTCTYTNVINSFDIFRELLTTKKYFTSIKRINFVDCHLSQIPGDVFLFYPNVEVIDAPHINLMVLDFVEHRNKIRMINASENDIQRIDSKLYENSAHLETLDLSHNRISTITPHTFEGSFKLKHLNLSYNQIKRIDFKGLSSIKNLDVLHLDHNQIKEIRGDFKDFKPNWKELYLQNNQLTTLGTSFVNSLSGSYLDISFNSINEAKFHDSNLIELKIQNCNLMILTIGKNLEKLDASFNKRVYFYIEFKNNTKLKFLNLANSHIESRNELTKAIPNFKRLQYLNLNHASPTGYLTQEMLKDHKELETLKLRNLLMPENTLSENDFVRMTKLTELDLSRNYYKEFDLNALNKSKNLEILSFRTCYARNLTGWRNLGTLFPKLKKIDFFQNMFPCDETKEMIDDFKKKGIEIVDLELFGEENFIKKSCKEDFASEEYDEYIDFDKDYGFSMKYRKKDKKDEPEKSDDAWWIVTTMFMICVVICGLVYVQRKFNIFTKITIQNRSEELISRES